MALRLECRHAGGERAVELVAIPGEPFQKVGRPRDIAAAEPRLPSAGGPAVAPGGRSRVSTVVAAGTNGSMLASSGASGASSGDARETASTAMLVIVSSQGKPAA